MSLFRVTRVRSRATSSTLSLPPVVARLGAVDPNQHDRQRAPGPVRPSDFPAELHLVATAAGNTGRGIEKEPGFDVREAARVRQARAELGNQPVQRRRVLRSKRV